MPNLEELRKSRIQKIKDLEKAGIDPYPATSKRTHTIAEILSSFSKLKKESKKVSVVGRLMAMRGHGGAMFLDIQDGTDKIQILFRKNKVGAEIFKIFKDNFDIGDFVEIKGQLCKTKTGQQSIESTGIKILTKSVRPLPEKWHGLKDIEERLRKRYLDILFNPEIKEQIEKRAIFWSSMREFLENKGFLEVETPVLETTPGGADANPFVTHHNALDMDVYLRISMGELWQKRLMVAGFEKTFEIGRQFRNEGMSPEHLQDYTQMEFYWAYADYNQGMKLTEEMYKYVSKKTFNTLKFKIKGFNVDLGKKWQIYDYQKIVKKETGIDILNTNLKQVEAKLKQLKIDYDKKGFNLSRGVDNLWKHCRSKIAGPGFLINHPVEVSPLAKRKEKTPELVQRFQVIIAGSELGNGYSELNNPIDQAERFAEQQKLRDKGDTEAQMHDYDFVEALEYGMPPTCGFGLSERLFSFLINKPAREAQIFPLMKPKQ